MAEYDRVAWIELDEVRARTTRYEDHHREIVRESMRRVAESYELLMMPVFTLDHLGYLRSPGS